MEGDPRQLFFLKTLLYNFFESTGLKVNYNKSMMLPINISRERLDLLAKTFGCSKGIFPSPTWVYHLESLSQKSLIFCL